MTIFLLKMRFLSIIFPSFSLIDSLFNPNRSLEIQSTRFSNDRH